VIALSSGAFPAALARAQAVRPDLTGPARAPGVSLEETARRAGEAWAAGRVDEALRLFRAGLELDPGWHDGWWHLALIHTNEERFAEAREALVRLVSLEPDAGRAWALLGLCEFRLQDYDRALAHLRKGTALGLGEGDALHRESLLHFALLLMRSGDFATASTHLARLASRRPEGPAVVTACGLLGLGMTRLPAEIPEADRDLVTTAGRAMCAALALRADEARKGFDELIARYPRARGTHFIYGVLLRHQASPEALGMLQKEVDLFPDHAGAHLEIAFEALDRGQPVDALAPARAAARLAPEVYSSHLALGRALLATEALDEGLAELEEAARLGPEVPDVYVALAQAYALAGRAGDVARAREKLRELDAKRGAQPD